MQRTLRHVTTAATAAALALGCSVLTGCDDDSGSAPAPGTTATPTDGSTSTSAAPTLGVGSAQLRVRVKRLAGHVPREERRAEVARIGSVIDSWFTGGFGFVDGDDASEPAAFAGFTPGAARQAEQQKAVTTSALLAPELAAAVPTRKSVRLSIFAPHGTAAGATADVTLVLVGLRNDRSKVELAVSGQLFLTKDSGWRIFGFDLQRSVGAVGTYRRTHRGDR